MQKTNIIKDNKLTEFWRNHPKLSSSVLWLLMLGALIGGPIGYNKIKEKKQNKTEKTVYEPEYESGTFGAYYERMQPITPLLIAKLIFSEGVRVNNQGLHVVYDDKTGKPLKPGETPQGNPTIGFGSTKLKDGSDVTSYTKPITNEEAYELALWHIEQKETFFGMYCYDVGCENVDINSVGEAFAIGSIMYNAFSKLIEPKGDLSCSNRFAKLRKLYSEYGYGLNDSMVKQCFAEYPIKNMHSFGRAWIGGESTEAIANTLGGFVLEGSGMWWRRWLEAGMMTGEINPQILLDCPVNGGYEFLEYMGRQKSAFWKKGKANKETYKIFKEWIKNPVNKKGESLKHWKKVRDYMPEYALAMCNDKDCKLGKRLPSKYIEKQHVASAKAYVFNYDSAYTVAITAYRAGDYNFAAKSYNKLIQHYPDNALLRNDLAATYNKLGR